MPNQVAAFGELFAFFTSLDVQPSQQSYFLCRYFSDIAVPSGMYNVNVLLYFWLIICYIFYITLIDLFRFLLFYIYIFQIWKLIMTTYHDSVA